jgi:uncharacterized protein YhjY with autotransporter beta-barrel domain
MKLLSRGILPFLVLTTFTPFASGDTLYYQGGRILNSDAQDASGPGNEDFNTAANWSTVPPNTYLKGGTSSVPGSGDIAVIQADLNSGIVYYTSQDSAFINNNAPETVVLNQTKQPNTVAGFLVSNFGFYGAGSGTVNFNNTSGPFTVQGTNATGGDFVVDGGVTLNYSGGAFNVSKGLIVIGDDETFTSSANNTLGGAGTFNINAGTFSFDTANSSPTQMIVGYSSSGGNEFTGTTGTVNQGSASAGTTSVVTTGSSLIIGYNSGIGHWNVTNGSTLQTGTNGSAYVIALGSNGAPGDSMTAQTINSQGTLTISGSSAFNLGRVNSNVSTQLQLGTTTANATVGPVGGSGTVVQNGASSVVNMSGMNTTVEVGSNGGGTGVYNLSAGYLNIGTNATDAVAFTLGATFGSFGTLNQSGGVLTEGNSGVTNGSTFTIGGDGIGTYNMTGGTATFYNGFDVGPNGTVNLNGGTIQVADNAISGTGNLNFDSGTLKLTAATGVTAYTYNFGGSFTGGTSTIDASAAGLTSFTFANALNGSGGLNLIGNGSTVFDFASAGGGAANTYTGSTGIFAGTLNATAADLSSAGFSSSLTIGATGQPATLNLSMGSTSATLAQAISGNGTLNVNFNAANETLSLTNGNSAVSSVNIVLGANTGPNASATPGTLQVFSGSFGNISDNGTGSNVIIGTPGVTSGGGSVFFGTTDYSGLTTVNMSYTLTAPNLSGSVINDGTLNVAQNIGVSAANTVQNSGRLTAGSIVGDVTSNTGVLVVTGPAGITGDVTSSSGTLVTTSVTGNVTSSGVFAASDTANTVTGNLTNSGTLMAISALPAVAGTPTFSVGGNLTSPGTLTIRLNGTVSDDYQVGGTADLDGGVVKVDVIGGGKIGTTTYTIVTGAAVTDAGTTLSPNTALFSYTLSNSGTAESLSVTQAPLGDYARTPNEMAVAKSVDGTDSGLFGYFGQVSLSAASSAIPAALEELTPESLQYARFIAFENSTFLAERMNGVDADLRGGYSGLDTSAISITAPGFDSSLGRSLGSLLAYDNPAFHQSAPNGVNYYPGEGNGNSAPASSSSSSSVSPAPTWDSSNQVISDTPNPYLADVHPGGPETPKMSEFIAGDVILADLNQNQSTANSPSSKASYTAGDATAGVSFRMTNHLAAGVLFDYNHTDAKTDSSGSKTKVDSYSPGLFATYFDHGFYANGLFSFGYNQYSNTRDIAFAGETASSKPNGQQYVGDLDFGYDFHPDRSWIVGPTLGVTYTHLDIDSFSETGAPLADLSVQDQSADSLRSRLGGHLIYQTEAGNVLLQPNLTAMWQHEFLDNGSGITSSFNDFSTSPFTIQTAAPSRDSALIGVGLTATINNSMAFYLNYLADVGASDYFAQSVVGGLKARF